jgi:hypothetical protein
MSFSVYVRDVAERAVKTAAQSAVAVLGVGAVGLLDVDWTNVASISGAAAVLSILTSIASNGFGLGANDGTASMVPEIVSAPNTHEK